MSLGAAKQRALLAMLAIHANRTLSADELMDGLWGEPLPRTAPKMVQQYVSQLRRLLADGRDRDAEILTRGRGYELRIDPEDVDAWRFERLVDAGEGRAALALWRGPPLTDVADEPFAAEEIRRLEALRRRALEQAIDADLDAGRHVELVPELEGLVGEHPLSERVHGQLMLALYRSQRQGDALAVYRDVRATLVGELGLEPGPPLRRLQEAILHQDPALDPPPPELPSELEATTPLAGREAELAFLRALWKRARAGEAVTVVLGGGEGIGRTRLAAELAAEAHAQGALVLCGTAAIARARAARTPTLLVVGSGEGLDTLTPGPRLVVVTRAGDELDAAEQLVLEPLGLDAVAAIARGYAPDGTDVPAADLLAGSGGVPAEVHRLAADWAMRGLAHDRERLRASESSFAAGLPAARSRAGPRTADGALVCPYKGLASFGGEDAPFFFGRERVVAQMVARLVGAPLLGVVGPSGSGKSSALRAGLLADLAGGVLPGSERWTRRVLRPGAEPMRALDRALGGAGENGRLLLAVDQFEELFSLCPDERERTAFVGGLAGLATDGPRPAAVVLAVRADFYGRCAAYPELEALLSANQVLVGPMRREELRRAIELPARHAGLQVEAELVDRLLADVEGEPGALPLLSSALLELWEERDGRRLTLEAYERTGGVRVAIARVAESAFARLDPRLQAVARAVLLRLAGEGGVRRRVPLSELDADRDPDVRRVLDVLADARLVTLSEGTAEVAHEALLSEWPRLRGWLEEDVQGRRVHHHLAEVAREWDVGGRDPGELYRGARLASTLDWSAEHAGELNAVERAFVADSRGEREREVRSARRTNRRLRALLAGVVGLLVLTAAAGALFLDQRGTARDEARTADADRLGAQALVEDDLDRSLLLARQGVALDDSLQTRGNLLAALLRSPAAVRISRVGGARLSQLALSPDGRTLAVGDEHGDVSWLDPATLRPQRPPYHTHTLYIRAIAYSPDGSRVLVGGFGAFDLLDGRTGRRVAALDLPHDETQYINTRYSPDGREVVTMHERPTGDAPGDPTRLELLRFDGRTGQRTGSASITGQGSLADIAAFTPNGRRLVTVERETAFLPTPDSHRVLHGSGVVVRDARTLRAVRSFPGDGVAGALSPGGRLFATGGDDGSVRVLDLRTGRARTAAGRHDAPVRDVRFTPDGRFLVSAGDDATVIVWDVARATALETFTGHSGAIAGLAVGPGGRRVYSAGADGTLITWDLAGNGRLGRPFEAGRTSGDRVLETTISPDGRTLATQQADGTISLVDLPTLRSRTVPLAGASADTATPYAPAFGPHGTLVVAGTDGLLALADAHTGRILKRMRGHRDIVFTPTLTRDRRVIASTGEDGTLRLWDTGTGRERGAPIELDGGAASDAVISPDGGQVAVATYGGGLDVFDVRSHRRLAALHVDETSPTAVAFSRDGRTLLGGSLGGRVRLFSARSLKPLAPALLTSAGIVATIDLSPDGRTLLTAGADGQVRLWDVASRRPIATPLPGQERINVTAHFSPDGRYVYAVFSNGRAYRWDVRPSAWTRQACSVAGRRLTRAEWHETLPDRPYAPAC